MTHRSQLKQLTLTRFWRFGVRLPALLTAAFAYGILVSSASVYAEPAATGTIDQIQAHCKKVLSGKPKKGCDDQDALAQARNAASYQCKDKSSDNNAKADCIVNHANAYIDKAKAKKPNGAIEFKKFLHQIALNDVNGDEDKLKTAAPEAGDAGDGSGDDGTDDVGPANTDPAADPNVDCTKKNCNIVLKYLNPLINLLSVSFGLIAVISLILGAINFITSEGDPQKSSRAKQRIFNTIFAVVAYLFFYAFIQFLIPGGAFK